MKIGKIELTQEKLIIAILAIIIAIALVVYFVVYAPVMKELKKAYLGCRSAENSVLECRNVIESAGKISGKRVLMTEKDVSHAIDELTKYGKLKGINFLSISPQKIVEDKNSQYKILPIKMEIESTYEQIGVFLGSLDKLEKGLVKVKTFEIIPDEENTRMLMTDLTVDMYLSIREDNE